MTRTATPDKAREYAGQMLREAVLPIRLYCEHCCLSAEVVLAEEYHAGNRESGHAKRSGSNSYQED